MQTFLWAHGCSSLNPGADLWAWVCLAGFGSQTHNMLSGQPHAENASLSGSALVWKTGEEKQNFFKEDWSCVMLLYSQHLK